MQRVAIITGASSGIGKECALLFKENGFKVFDISKTIDETLPFEHYACDINDHAKIGEIFSEIFEKEKRIDVLVNNAGFGIAGAIEDAKIENVKKIVETNLTSLIVLSKLAIPFLKQSDKARIVNISSVGGLIALPFQACYSATKAGVETFSKALAIELKGTNIRVTAILPGDTKTGFTSARIVDDSKDSALQNRMTRSTHKMAHDEQNGMSPAKVAKVVLKVVKSKHPPLRKAVGFASKFEVFLIRFLPTKLINKIVGKIYG